jgi:hypothetical protein
MKSVFLICQHQSGNRFGKLSKLLTKLLKNNNDFETRSSMPQIKLRDSLVGGAVGIVFLVFGGILFWSTLIACAKARESLKWNSVTGQVIEFTSHLARNGNQFYMIRYKYEFAGKFYEGNKFNFGLNIDTEHLPVFQAGDAATIFVNPQHPNESVLLSGVTTTLTKVFCAIGGIIFFLGMLFFILTTLQVIKTSKMKAPHHQNR